MEVNFNITGKMKNLMNLNKLDECFNEKMQECKNALMRECFNARIRECESVRIKNLKNQQNIV